MNNYDASIWESGQSRVLVATASTRFENSTCRIRVHDHQSAVFELVHSTEPFQLILDLQTSIEKIQHDENDSFIYSYDRLGLQGEIDFSFSDEIEADAIISSIQALEFVWCQYTLYSEHNIDQLHKSSDIQKPNMIARGLEGMGVGLRVALRSGGRSTGTAIRYLGKKYTAATVKDNTDGLREYKATDEAAIIKAEARKSSAETCHASARTLTSAALAPVRWIGKNASRLAPKNSSSDGQAKKIVLDTVGGIGNGVANICKVIKFCLTTTFLIAYMTDFLIDCKYIMLMVC